ncbi:MAG: glycosyltransferase family 39 protein, partial [Chloroflexota bacterium]
ALLFGTALAVRVMTYERFIPALDYTDETGYYAYAEIYRGNPDRVWVDRNVLTPPPMHAFLSSQILNLADAVSDDPFQLPSTYFGWLRGWAAVLGVATTVIIAWAAWELGGPLAGWLAAFVWGLHPQIIDINSLLIADGYMFFFVALALATSIRAWKTDSPWWLLLSLLAGISAIYSKFWVASAVFPFLATAAVMTARAPRRMVPWLALYAVIAASTAYGLLVVVDPLSSSSQMREVSTFNDDGLSNAFDPWRVTRNW